MVRFIFEFFSLATIFIIGAIFIFQACADEAALRNCIQVCHPRETKAYNIKDKTCVCEDKAWTEVKE